MTTVNRVSTRTRKWLDLPMWGRFLIALLFAAIIIVPLVTAWVGGFKTNAELLINPFALPKEAQIQNYIDVLSAASFWRMLLNSVVVSLSVTTGVVALSAMTAYGLSRIEFRGRELVYNFFTLGLLFPAAVAILPLYLTVRDAGLTDTYWGLILPQVAFGIPGNIVLLRGFFSQVPQEIEEAAAIDGASIIRMFFAVVLPIMRPALAAVAVLTMVASWNAFFWPLLVVNSEALITLPLGIMQFSSQYGTDYGRVLAFISISMVPALIFYFFAEKQIVAGLTGGAVKG